MNEGLLQQIVESASLSLSPAACLEIHLQTSSEELLQNYICEEFPKIHHLEALWKVLLFPFYKGIEA